MHTPIGKQLARKGSKPTAAYQTFLFDFDYTLADSSQGILLCFRNVLQRHSYTDVTDEAIKSTIGKTLEESFAQLTGTEDAALLAQYKQEYTEEAAIYMTPNTRLYPETIEVLTALKAKGARIGIISTKYRFRIKELTDRQIPPGTIDLIVGGEDVLNAKPNPEGICLALERLKADKATTLYIGDSIVDAETARRAEVDFAGVTHGVTTAEALMQYPHRWILPDLRQLPDYVDNRMPGKKRRINTIQGIWLVLSGWMALDELLFRGSVDSMLVIFLLSLWSISRKRQILSDKWDFKLKQQLLPLKKRIRAWHIQLIRGKETPPRDAQPYTCLNCGTSYEGNFCPRCGQSSRTTRYRWSNMLKNILGGFFNIDKGFGRTTADLLHRPGYMIYDFIAGRRIEQFRPFQMLFILAAIYIMAVQLIDPDALRRGKEEKNVSVEELTDLRNSLNEGLEADSSQISQRFLQSTLGVIDRKIAQEMKNDSLRTANQPVVKEGYLVQFTRPLQQRIQAFCDQSPVLSRVTNLLKGWFHGNKAFHILITLPLFALASLIVFRKRFNQQYNLTEHIFIQAYFACQMLLLSILILPLRGHATAGELYELPAWCIFLTFFIDYKQLYRCTWWRGFWSTVKMFCWSGLILGLLALLLVLLAMLCQ